MVFQIKNLIKSYDTRTVLDLPELSFEKGKVHGLLGPNGAGKTTLLEILAFLLPPTSGDVLFKGELVDYGGIGLRNFRQNVVLVQQHPIMFSTTVFSNVEFPLKIRKVSKVERERTIKELLALVGMESFENAKAHRLSGGETQRVAIAQAIACSPSVILLDEPTASVDVENQVIIERIIKEISREKGISVIMTTHDIVQASRVADEFIFLFDGKLAQSKYENIFNGNIENGTNGKKFCVLMDGVKFTVVSRKSGPVRVSINPESLEFCPTDNYISVENCLKGRLIQLTDEKTNVRALVDVGIPLSLLVPKAKLNGIHLNMGEEVGVMLDSRGVEIF